MKLTASYLTLAGASFGRPARYGIAERSHAACLAGYAGIGVLNAESCAGLPAVLPCPVTELEWAELGAPFTMREAGAFCAMADRFGTVTRINAGTGMAGAGQVNDRDVAGRLAMLARAVASRGITVMLEPVAFGPCWHPGRIMRLIAMAGQPNVRFLYDTWHVARARERGARFTVPPGIVGEVQLSGYVHRSADAFADAMDRGAPDTSAMAELRALRCDGYTGPVDVEAPLPAMRDMPIMAMARATYPREETMS